MRLHWDPDPAPDGSALPRRALQPGLRGQTLRQYGERQAISITDIADFVHVQAANLQHGEASRQVSYELVHVPQASAAQNIGLDNQPCRRPQRRTRQVPVASAAGTASRTRRTTRAGHNAPQVDCRHTPDVLRHPPHAARLLG
ncbi:hypothetical protein CEK66_17475 [Xanthomonas sp. LMG 12460]|nr:hypothetical protein CEK66_17475 [Xanthomonas sp. LMG 12460]